MDQLIKLDMREGAEQSPIGASLKAHSGRFDLAGIFLDWPCIVRLVRTAFGQN